MIKLLTIISNKLNSDLLKIVPKSKYQPPSNFQDIFPDFSTFHTEIIDTVKEFTMTSPERLYALINSVNYIVQNNISGSIVECGVWKGGSIMTIAKTLLSLGVNNRELYLYDTFEAGMTPPDCNKDISLFGIDAKTALEKWEALNNYPTIDKVRENVYSIGYPSEQIKFVKGDVMKTLINEKPESISILRLDTDWYESTKFELEKLYPLLSKNGVLIIDDYGHWKGARLATDEYFNENNIKILLNRIDYTCRLGIKI